MKMKQHRLHVNHAVLVDIVRAAGYQRRANNAPLVLVKVMQGKRRAFPVVPVNSTILLVMSSVNCVQMRRTLVEKEEAAVALIAQPVGRPKTAVRNVSRAVRVRLALGV